MSLPVSIKGNTLACVPDSLPDCQALKYFVTVVAPTMARHHTVNRLTIRNIGPPTMAQPHTVSRVTFRNIGPPTIRSASLASLVTFRNNGPPTMAR